MPYIPEARRRELEAERFDRVGAKLNNPGELNYVITTICCDYEQVPGRANYATYNAIIGVLEAAKLEFYRRLVADYEDGKAKENGDVYA